MYIETLYSPQALQKAIKKLDIDFADVLKLIGKKDFEYFKFQDKIDEPIIKQHYNGPIIVIPRRKGKVALGIQVFKSNLELGILLGNEIYYVYKLKTKEYNHDVNAVINAVGMEIEIEGPASASFFSALTGYSPTYDGSLNKGAEFKVRGFNNIMNVLKYAEKYDRYSSKIISTHIHTSYALIYPLLMLQEMTDYYVFRDLLNIFTHSYFSFNKFFGRSYNWAAEENVKFKTEGRYSALTFPDLDVNFKDLRVYNKYPEFPDLDGKMNAQPTVEFRLPRITSREQFFEVYRWLLLLINYGFLKVAQKYFKDRTVKPNTKLLNKIINDTQFCLTHGKTFMLEKTTEFARKIIAKLPTIQVILSDEWDTIKHDITPDKIQIPTQLGLKYNGKEVLKYDVPKIQYIKSMAG